MADRTTCPICSKSVAYSGLPKHIFSEEHKRDLMVGLKKRSKYLVPDLKAHPEYLPFIKCKDTRLHLCYGCKKCYRTEASFKTHTCAKMAEGLKHVNDILAMPEFTVEPPEAKAPPLPPQATQAEVVKLQKQLDTVKSQFKVLEKDYDEVMERSGKSEAMFAGLAFLLDYLKQEECYDSVMENFREAHPDLMPLLKDGIGDI